MPQKKFRLFGRPSWEARFAKKETREVAVRDADYRPDQSTTDDPCEGIQSVTIALSGPPLKALKAHVGDEHKQQGGKPWEKMDGGKKIAINGNALIMIMLGLKEQASLGYTIVELEMGRKQCEPGIVFTTITRIARRKHLGRPVVTSYMQRTVIAGEEQERNNFQKIFDMMGAAYTQWQEKGLQGLQQKIGPEYQLVHGTKADRD